MAGGAAAAGGTGGIFGLVGKIAKGNAEAKADQTNADWLNSEAEFAKEWTRNETIAATEKYTQNYGDVVSGIGKGGVQMSGSPLLVLASQKLKEHMELQTISQEGSRRYTEAKLKAMGSEAQAAGSRNAQPWELVAGTLGVGAESYRDYRTYKGGG